MMTAAALCQLGPAPSERQAKTNIVAAVDQVAERLGNTRAVCRKYYVHPVILDAYLKGEVPPIPPEPPSPARGDPTPAIRRDEAVVLDFLQQRTRVISG